MASFPLKHESIVMLATTDWDFLWQSHHETAVRLAAAGNAVTYVENMGARTVRPSDLARIMKRLQHWLADELRAPRARPEGVTVVSPALLPFPRSGLAAAINERFLIPRLARRVGALQSDAPIILTLLPTPAAARLIHLLHRPGSTLVYWCLADFQELSDLGSLLEESERSIVRAADLVFVQTAAFARRFAADNPRVHEIPIGVNLETFTMGVDPAPELSGLSRPLIGYVGGLHRYVDFDLIAKVARSWENGSVVLVGPVQSRLGELESIPNVHLLGARPTTELPGLLASLDVGLIPYVRNAYTETVFPSKLFEYLAMGAPVVATCLPELVKLSLPQSALRMSDDPQDFVRLTGVAVTDHSADARELRASLARERDWTAIIHRMADLISGARGPLAEQLPARPSDDAGARSA